MGQDLEPTVGSPIVCEDPGLDQDVSRLAIYDPIARMCDPHTVLREIREPVTCEFCCVNRECCGHRHWNSMSSPLRVERLHVCP
jgi:hypothetical protein